jgi:threonine synthase
MMYCSTSGRSPEVDFRSACFNGLAPDGGLYVPASIPRLDPAVFSLPFHDAAAVVLSRFVTDIPEERLRSIVRSAFNFEIPLVPLAEHTDLLELFHGPTLAFKDVGARFMAGVLAHYLEHEERELTIAVATSGDTGSAVARGFLGMPRLQVYVLYPSGRISRLQEQQMATLGQNIHALEVEGSFDDCQRLLKQALGDPDVVSRLALTTANSINVGRLLPQVSYYVWACAQWMSRRGRGAPPAVVVPCGNLGNITSAAYAKQMGAPLGRLIGATNRNRVFVEYLASGRFAPEPSVQTLSNAMDVGNPSNLARLQQLYGSGMRDEITAAAISDDETLAEIRSTHERFGTLVDPHTAVGLAAVRRLKLSGDVIVASTAHPAKFPEIVEQATGTRPALPAELERVLHLPKQSTTMSATYDSLKRILLSEP